MSQTNVVQQTESLEEEEREQGKQKKQKSRRPASLSPIRNLSSSTLLTELLHRHRLSTTEIESMAVSASFILRVVSVADPQQTHSYSQNRPSHLLRDWHHIRSDRWAFAMGERNRMTKQHAFTTLAEHNIGTRTVDRLYRVQ